MYDHHKNDLVEAFIKAKLIPVEKAPEARAAIDKTFRDIIFIGWTTGDIKSSKRYLTKDQRREILGNILDNFDANQGINWEVINNAVSDYVACLPPKPKKKGKQHG